jgi:stage II sporulation protein D
LTVRITLRILVVVLFVALQAVGPSGPHARAAQTDAPAAEVRIGVLKNGTYEVVSLPLETYVARVLAGEALPGSAPAAMEALAIAIRTYTVENLGRHRGEGFDLCDQTHCQVMRNSSLITERAAAATAGQILLYRGEPATVYYSASCGGHTEKPSNVWPGAEDPPYLPSQDDDGCGGAPAWSSELSLADLERAFVAAGYRGRLRDMRVARRNDARRVQELQLEGMTPPRISGQDLRVAVGRTLGWQYVQSTLFELTRNGNAVRLRGQGNGHGVGMCVIGSSRLAAAGRTASQILRQYYPGTTIAPVPPRLTRAQPNDPSAPRAAGGATPATVIASAPASTSTRPGAPAPAIASAPAIVPAPSSSAAAAASGSASVAMSAVSVTLPDAQSAERGTLQTLIARERETLAASLGIPAPPPVDVRFHATTDAFQAATGQPWYVLGAARGTELHFVPVSTLRDRGVLERTVRRELVRAMTADALAGRPAWVREGAAIHFAEGTNAPERRDSCPQDAELLRPASIGALTDAYARARACFERQLSAGRKWNEIK